jgi:hypothetical protein
VARLEGGDLNKDDELVSVKQDPSDLPSESEPDDESIHSTNGDEGGSPKGDKKVLAHRQSESSATLPATGHNLITDQHTIANRSRIRTALPQMAAYFTGKNSQHHILLWLLTLASGVGNEESEEAFLIKHPIFDGTAIELHIKESPSYLEVEKVQAKAKLAPEEWNEGGARQFWNCCYLWFICASYKPLMIKEHGPGVDLPLRKERCWFYLTIQACCKGNNSFNAMNSLAFNYENQKDLLHQAKESASHSQILSRRLSWRLRQETYTCSGPGSS